MKMNSILSGFQSLLPSYHLKQSEILDWMKLAHRHSEDINPTTPSDFPLERFIERYAVKNNLIEERYFECDDVFNKDWETNSIYRITKEQPHGLDIYQRNQFFLKRTREVLHKLFPLEDRVPHHLIHVTCTGYLAPSPAQILSSERNWDDTSITHAYHMGCYAAMPSIRMAQAFHTQSQKTIDVVHTELCSLHMNPSSHDPEQIVVQSLFADGHIKYRIGEKESDQAGFEIIRIKEKIVPESILDMTWTPAAWGMNMTLSREVPEKLKKIIREFYTELIDEAHLDPATLLKSATFAVHPGGPKIIEAIQQELELSDEQIAVSKKILRSRGNMSSATLPHIWQELLKDGMCSSDYVVSFAFGPGLTMFGSVFRKRA